MVNWREFPLVKLILPFIAGIIIATKINLHIHIPFVFVWIVLVFVFFTAFFPKYFSVYRYRWTSGLVIFVFFMILGFEYAISKNRSYHLPQIPQKLKVFAIAKILEPVEGKAKSVKSVLKLESIKVEGKWVSISEKMIIYLEIDSNSLQLEYGDKLIFYSQLNLLHPPKNPGEFNFKRYLSNKQIYYQTYVKSQQWEKIGENHGNLIKKYSYLARAKVIELLEKSGMGEREFAVCSALMVGYKEKLDDEIFQDYSGAGAMHILCVSGLHVGIIYLLLTSIFIIPQNRKSLKWIKAVILLLFIWFYAFLTGLAPSVQRAVTMFSFIIIGNAISRKAQIYNSLASSAFILLAINPFLIFEVGFQLSYLAVLAIVSFQPKIYRLFIFKKWLPDKMWQITSVSIAAQLGTFPLGLYYFHQFPNYFILSNLVIIPVAGFIIYSGLAYLISSGLPFLGWLTSKILYYLVYFMNFTVTTIENLPGSTAKGVFISPFETLILFGLILLLFVYFFSKRTRVLYIFLIFSIFLLGSFSYNKFDAENQRKIIFYDIKKRTAIEFVDGRISLLIASDSVINDERTINFHIVNSQGKMKIKENKKLTSNLHNTEFERPNFYKNHNLMQFCNIKIGFANPETISKTYAKKMNLDYMVINGNPKISIKNLLKSYNFKFVIVDSSNSFWNTEKWKKECQEMNIIFHSTSDSGALVLNI